MKKIFFVSLFILSLIGVAQAQVDFSRAKDFAFGSFNHDELAMTKYAKDETAHAVFLNEFGDASLFSGGWGKVTLQYIYHARIKILDTAGLRYGTVKVPLLISDVTAEVQEDIDEIRAITIYTDDKGNTKSEELLPAKISDKEENKNLRMIKFTLPALRPGCIVEYKYRVTTPNFGSFHDWQFQADIPKVHSRYDVHIPDFWKYNAVMKGDLKLTKNVTDKEIPCFISGDAKCNCARSVYEMNDIPAFIEGAYMTAAKNFKSAIYFELTEYVNNAYSGSNIRVAAQWKDIDELLKKSDLLGAQLKKKDALKDRIAAPNNITDPLDKAKAIYAQVQQNMKWNGVYSFGSENIRKAYDKHTGSVGDINLALVSALNAAGLATDPVVLSTRDHGVINRSYPVLTDLNYVVARVTIGDKVYLLDATDPLLAFGVLPLRCFNGKGRLISLDKTSDWVDIITDQNQNTTYALNLTLQDNGKLKGTLFTRSYGYAGYLKRKAIKSFNSVDEYAASVGKRSPKVKISKTDITNLDSLDLSLNEVYEIEIDAVDAATKQISFDPYMFNKMATNPFEANDRDYPVDLGMTQDTKLTLSVQLPEGYTIENAPKSTSMTLPEQGGRYVLVSDPNENAFSLSNIISLKKPIYSIDEYPSLKDFYGKVVEQENAAIIFKKKM